jgi:hypothetical protein
LLDREMVVLGSTSDMLQEDFIEAPPRLLLELGAEWHRTGWYGGLSVFRPLDHDNDWPRSPPMYQLWGPVWVCLALDFFTVVSRSVLPWTRDQARVGFLLWLGDRPEDQTLVTAAWRLGDKSAIVPAFDAWVAGVRPLAPLPAAVAP